MRSKMYTILLMVLTIARAFAINPSNQPSEQINNSVTDVVKHQDPNLTTKNANGNSLTPTLDRAVKRVHAINLTNDNFNTMLNVAMPSSQIELVHLRLVDLPGNVLNGNGIVVAHDGQDILAKLRVIDLPANGLNDDGNVAAWNTRSAIAELQVDYLRNKNLGGVNMSVPNTQSATHDTSG